MKNQRRPLTESEKCSGQHATKEAALACFTLREVPAGKTKIMASITTTCSMEATVAMSDNVAADALCSAVTEIINDPQHAEFHKSRAPAAMLGFAKVTVERTVLNEEVDVSSCFDGLTMTAPLSNENSTQPHCPSIVGHKLSHVDWKQTCGLHIACPWCQLLANQLTPFSPTNFIHARDRDRRHHQHALMPHVQADNKLQQSSLFV